MLSFNFNDKAVDVIFKSASKFTSLSAEGFSVSALANEGDILVIGLNPSPPVLEHYLFRLDSKGNGLVVWGTARAGGWSPKSSLMTAICKAPV